MAKDTMKVIITLTKSVDDADEGKAIYELVKQKMQDKPEVAVHGHISNHFDMGD